MSIEYTIFEFLKQYLYNSNFSFSFQNLDELDEYKVGIFLLGSTNTTRSVDNLKIKQFNNQLVLNINTDSTQKGFEDGYSFCEEMTEKLLKLKNIIYNNLFISHFDLTTSTAYLGRANERGINKYSINFVINYTKI